VFDIAFIADEPERQEGGWYALRGRTVLGDFREEFLAALGYWDRAGYERHWIEAARRLLAGADRTGFFTSTFQLWWVMWRRGDELAVHEMLLAEDALLERFDPADPYRQLRDYSDAPNEEGQRPSEWRLRVADIAAFVERRAAQYVPG
jgi:hypothetical protein